jgi:hypothetical protein
MRAILPGGKVKTLHNLHVAVYDSDRVEVILGNNIVKDVLGIDVVDLLAHQVQTAYDCAPAGERLRALLHDAESDVDQDDTEIDPGLLPDVSH